MLHRFRSPKGWSNARQVLDCASPLALSGLLLQKRQRTGALQNASARKIASLLVGALLSFSAAAYAGVEQTVADLLPKLAAAKVEDRYAPQMELQALALNAARPGAEAERAALAGLLAAKATDAAVPQPARVWVVRQLEYIGGGESVAALASLLTGPDAELKECARRALEKNPTPAAGERLRAALKQGGPVVWKLGLIQSLGERHDAEAVALIRADLSSKDTAPAAAAALGKIADGVALAALWEAQAGGVPGAADALVMAGDRLLVSGNKAAAKEIFRDLYSRKALPSQTRSAALVGWARADADSARAAVAEALQQNEPALQFAAVTAATAAFGHQRVSAALAPLLSRLPASAKAYVLRVLDASAEKDVIAAAGDADQQVRLAALERLGQIGGTASVPVLFQAMVKGPASVENAALTAAARVSGPEVGAAIAQAAARGEPKLRVAAMRVLVLRNDVSAAPALLRYAQEADPAVSRAACDALAQLGTDKELDGLIALALAGKTPGADVALQGVARRAADKSAAAHKVLAKVQTAGPEKLGAVFEVLSLLGGNESLGVVLGFAGSSNADVKDAAIRALANWPDFAAAKPLLIIALDPHANRVHNALAVQAIARLVESADQEPAAARVDAALSGLRAAKRDEDKKLLLSAIAAVRDKKAVDALRHLMLNPQLKSDAGQAALNLADSLRKRDRALANDLAQSVKQANISAEINQKADALLERKK